MITRLGIIGDLHGEADRLAAALDWFAGKQLDALICTGDIADGRGCINETCELLRDAGVITVAGNHDRWLLADRVRHLPDAHQLAEVSEENAAFIGALPRWRRLETGLGPLMLCHGVADNDMAKVWPGRPGSPRMPIERSTELDQLIVEDEFRFLINGHMHFRVMLDFENLLMLNAGTIKGDYAGITLVDFQEGSITAFSIEDHGAPRELMERDLHPGNQRPVWRNTEEFDGSHHPTILYVRD